MDHISKFAKDASLYTSLLSHIASREEQATEMKSLDGKGVEVLEEPESLGYESDEWSLVSEGKDEEGVMSGSEDESDEENEHDPSKKDYTTTKDKEKETAEVFEVQQLQASGRKTGEAEPTSTTQTEIFDSLRGQVQSQGDDVKILFGNPFSPRTQTPSFDRQYSSEEKIGKALDQRLKIVFFDEEDRCTFRCTVPYCDRSFPTKGGWRDHFELRHWIEFERVRDAVRLRTHSPPSSAMGSGPSASSHPIDVKYSYDNKGKSWDPSTHAPCTMENMMAPQPRAPALQPLRPQIQRENASRKVLPAMGRNTPVPAMNLKKEGLQLSNLQKRGNSHRMMTPPQPQASHISLPPQIPATKPAIRESLSPKTFVEILAHETTTSSRTSVLTKNIEHGHGEVTAKEIAYVKSREERRDEALRKQREYETMETDAMRMRVERRRRVRELSRTDDF